MARELFAPRELGLADLDVTLTVETPGGFVPTKILHSQWFSVISQMLKTMGYFTIMVGF